MVRLEPSKGPPAAHPRPSPNSWRGISRLHAVVPLHLRCSRTGRNEAVEHFNGAREGGLEYQNAVLVGLVSPSSVVIAIKSASLSLASLYLLGGALAPIDSSNFRRSSVIADQRRSC